MATKNLDSSLLKMARYIATNFKSEFQIEELLEVGGIANKQILKDKLRLFPQLFDINIKKGLVTPNLEIFTRISDPENDPKGEFLAELVEQIIINENVAQKSLERR